MNFRGALFFALLAMLPLQARADDATSGPCTAPAAAALADRPGTGRTTSAGGAPCVALPGDLIIEDGVRRQVTNSAGGRSVLLDGPLTFVRAGVAPRLELGIVLPAPQSRMISGNPPFDNAHGSADTVLAAKVLVTNTNAVQSSLGFAYAPPTGSGEFTAGAPTYALSFNAGVAFGSRWSITASPAIGTAAGPDASGATRTYFVFAPSVTLGYAVDAVTTVLLQDALLSRQGPVAPAGSRGYVAVQHALGNRLVADIEFEVNLASANGPSRAVGFGLVWITTRR